MPKLGMEAIRKASAINAALECISEFGIDGITLDMVAARAGFSKGIVAYYFKNKKQLIIESMKAFFFSYQLKTKSSITSDMRPADMIKKVVEIALPPMSEENGGKINVSSLEGAEKINLPQKTIAKLFIQFVSKAANDEEIKELLKEIYKEDIKGIAALFKFACTDNKDDHEMHAYGLLAMIYGLSFFRVADFFINGKQDNSEVAFDFLNKYAGVKGTESE